MTWANLSVSCGLCRLPGTRRTSAPCLAGRPAELWVAQDNARARRFYEKNGFVHEGDGKVDADLDGLIEARMVP